MMLTSDPFQIISLIGFPKPQIFIFSPVLKARCDNTAAVLRYRRPRKQTQRRVRLLRFSKDAQKEMKRTLGRSRIREQHQDCGRSDHQTVFFFPLEEADVVGPERGRGFNPLSPPFPGDNEKQKVSDQIEIRHDVNSS